MRSCLFFLSVALFSASLAGCQSTASSPSFGEVPASGGGISRPGTFTQLRNPDANKWQVTANANGVMRLICRPLACPEPSLLIMAHGRSPTRNPDPAALQRLARETIPTNIQADDLRVDTASKGHVHLKLGKSEVATVRGFPAVVVDYQRTGVGRPDYAVRTIVFAGLNMITVTSASKSPAVAHQNMDDAIAAMDILDMPPPPSPKVGASNPPAHEAVADAKK